MYLQTESEKQDENILKPEKLTREKPGENLEASHLKILLRLTKIVNALEPRPSKRNEPKKTSNRGYDDAMAAMPLVYSSDLHQK